LRLESLAEGEQCCPFCGKFLQANGRGSHIKSHVRGQGLIGTPFSCFACKHSGIATIGTLIDGPHEWDEHVRTNHDGKFWLLDDLNLGTLTKNFECLLCGNRFAHRGALSEHCRNLLVKKGTFQSPFECLSCPGHIIKSAASWSNHTETAHGKGYSPCLPDLTSCPFCGKEVVPKSLNKHMRSHIPDGTLSPVFESNFDCQACLQKDKVVYSITGSSQWDQHVRVLHKKDEGCRMW
jgi:hypothetical protein